MSVQTADVDVIPSTLVSDIEMLIESRLQQLRQYDTAPAQTIFMKKRIDGPYDDGKALIEIISRKNIVTVELKMRKRKLSDIDVEYGETTLSDHGENYNRYATIVGETVATALSCKPDAFSEMDKDEIEFVQYATFGEGHYEPNVFTVFACEFDTEFLGELDELW